LTGPNFPLYVILKHKMVPKETIPAGIIVHAQEKSWGKSALVVVDWLKVVFWMLSVGT